MKNLLFIFTFIIAANGQAQLTQANNAPVVGDTYQTWQCDSTGVSVGGSGANAVWSFSAIPTRSNIQTSYTAVAVTGTAFPSATVAVASSSSDVSYYNSDAAKLEYYGGNISIGIVKATLNYSAPAIAATYPMNLNSTATQTIGGSLTITISPFPPASGTFTGSSTVLADGSGTLILPGSNATFTNVIRVLTTQTIVFSSMANGTVTQVNYNYYTPDLKAPLFTISTSTAEVSGFAPTSSTLVTRNSNPVIVPVGMPVQNSDVQEFQVFPNPSNGHVNFSANGINNISKINVTDCTGKMLHSLTVSGPQITTDLSDLSSGIYFYHALGNEGETIKSGKIVIRH